MRRVFTRITSRFLSRIYASNSHKPSSFLPYGALCLAAASIPVSISKEKDQRMPYLDALKYVKENASKIKQNVQEGGKNVSFPHLNVSKAGEFGVKVSLKAPASAFATVNQGKEDEEEEMKRKFMEKIFGEKEGGNEKGSGLSPFVCLTQLFQNVLGVGDASFQIFKERHKKWWVFTKVIDDLSQVELWVDPMSSPSSGLEIVIRSENGLSKQELNGILKLYSTLGKATAKAYEELESLGVRVFSASNNTEDTNWDALGGYELVKSEIQNSLLLALQYPDVFEKIAKETRGENSKKGNKIRAVLFEGPPGTGKTTTARILASISNIPLIYMPLEAVVSKWYGESEKTLGKIFDEANKLGDCIIFIDEIDSLGHSRDSQQTHEASARLLSVLLQRIDGFEASKRRTMVIGATNRKAALDPALLSRFDMSIQFPYPNQEERKDIFKVHAKHLDEKSNRAWLLKLAEKSSGMSGRDIRDLCMHAEREWASHLIKSGKHNDSSSITAPPAKFYEDALERKSKTKGIDQEHI